MASSGKKKGKKGVTLSLTSFLADKPSSGGSDSGGYGGGGGGGGRDSGGYGGRDSGGYGGRDSGGYGGRDSGGYGGRDSGGYGGRDSGSYGGRDSGSYGGRSGGGGSSAPYKSKNWADEMDDQDDDDGGSGYGVKSNIDRSQLPTAPRAARGPDIDLSKVPSNPPFKAYLGNLPYDIVPEDIEHFFCKLSVIGVSLPQDQGRQKGFGYAEFEDRQALIDALSMNDESLKNRKIRVDLAAQTSDRDGGFRRHDDGDDRTSGDWRKKDDRPAAFDNNRNDRGGFDRRDRFDDRDRDRGSSSWGNRDRDRGFDDRSGRSDSDTWERGGGRDNFSRDRDGYNRDRDGFSRDRDGGGRREFGSGYGGERRDDRPGDRYQPPRDRGYDRPPPPRDDYDRDGPPRDSKERPRLNLQKRTKPVEDPAPKTDRAAAIFGSAKPVDTAARERQIEERLIRQREEEKREEYAENESRDRLGSQTSQRTRKESSGSADGGTQTRGDTRRERKLSSSSSGKGIRTVAPPPGSGSARVRCDSVLSDEEDVFNNDDKPTSPTGATPPKHKDDAKLVPAPPPKENIWEKRKGGPQSPPAGVTAPVTAPVTPPSQTEAATHRDAPRGKEQSQKSPKEFVPAEPPKENIWERRRQDRPEDAGPTQPPAPTGAWRRGGGAPRGRGGPASRGGHSEPPRAEKKERPVPKSIDEMPKMVEDKSKDFSDSNKFMSLMVDEDEKTSNNSDD